MHDQVYSQELSISNGQYGCRDILAWIDLSTFRRIPWENNVPFFLVTFKDPNTKNALAVDPRNVVARVELRAIQDLGFLPYAGVEYEVGVMLLLAAGERLIYLSISISKVDLIDNHS